MFRDLLDGAAKSALLFCVGDVAQNRESAWSFGVTDLYMVCRCNVLSLTLYLFGSLAYLAKLGVQLANASVH